MDWGSISWTHVILKKKYIVLASNRQGFFLEKEKKNWFVLSYKILMSILLTNDAAKPEVI